MAGFRKARPSGHDVSVTITTTVRDHRTQALVTEFTTTGAAESDNPYATMARGVTDALTDALRDHNRITAALDGGSVTDA